MLWSALEHTHKSVNTNNACSETGCKLFSE